MKILAAVMDVVFVKQLITRGFNNSFEQYRITKTKRYLVYDPRKVVIRKIDDARAKQIR